MNERFQLVFKGETLEGQPIGKVAERLGELLGLDQARARGLFAGRPVVIKRSVERADAARYQAAFKAAGARLRVVPLQPREAAADASPVPAPAGSAGAAGEPTAAREPAAAGEAVPASAAAAPGAPSGGDWHVTEQQGDLVRADEMARPAPVRVDTGHLQLAPKAPLPESEQELARVSVPVHDILPAGRELPPQPRPEPVRVNPDRLQLAPAEGELPLAPRPPAPLPDISHLRLADKT